MIYKKYYLYKEQVSLDNGVTWEDVTPAVTRPDGDPIGEYATLEECEGITPLCDCSAFTPSSSITVPSSGGTVTLGTFSDDCLNGFSYSFTTPTGMITSAAVSAGTNVSAYTAIISSNESSSSRSGTITVTYNAGQDSCSTSAIPISQSAETQTCDCDSFVFEGTSEGNNTYRIDVPSGETGVTAATWDTSCGVVPQDFTHTDDAGFQEIVTDGHWAFTDNVIRFTASTNPTSSVREGNMTITYTVDGNNCTKVTHLVQAAGTGSTPSYDFKLAIDVPAGKTSPVIQFYTANGTYMGGYGRVSTDSEVEITWQGSGTVTKMTFAENGSYLSAVTVHGHAGVTLINNQPLNSGSVTTIDLLQNINTADYSDGTKTIYVSFSE